MNFEVTVNVQVGVTPEVVSLVSAILGGKQSAQEQVAAAPAAAAEPAPAPKPRTRKPKAEDTPAPEAPAEPAPAAEPQQETTGDLPFATEDEAHEAVRAAMDETRRRIEGEDYKENTTGERYTKYHKRLTAVFKSIAKDLSGQEKPSALNCEHSSVFVEVCKRIVEAADGTVETPKVN